MIHLALCQGVSNSQCWFFDVQNAVANVKKTGGNTKSICLSRRFDNSPDLALLLLWETLLLFIYLLWERIQAYSRMAKMMNPTQAMIHCIMAVTVPPDFGVALWVEFKVLTAQRKKGQQKAQTSWNGLLWNHKTDQQLALENYKIKAKICRISPIFGPNSTECSQI